MRAWFQIAADPYQTTNVTNPSFTVDSSNVPPDSGINYATMFYADDHLGTAQMELALGGWPVWKGNLLPLWQILEDFWERKMNDWRMEEHQIEMAIE